MRESDHDAQNVPGRKLLAQGVLLFDHGYYWEAHETWEQLWIQLGRKGRDAGAVKGLIKLAACGVKCLEANRTGAERHALRAAELLTVTETQAWLCEVVAAARQVAINAGHQSPVLNDPSDGTPQPLPTFEISPRDAG